MQKYLKINPLDNVMVALTDLKEGQTIENIRLLCDIQNGHKFAVCNIKKGDNIIKYGQPIGYALQDIQAGSHVHTHNTKTNLSDKLEYSYNPQSIVDLQQQKPLSVNVYQRNFGLVGIRNELWVIPTVGCVNMQCRAIVDTFLKNHNYNIKGVDGAYAFSHPYGCSQVGDDHQRTKTLLQQMAKHPNAGGVLVLGLGCENNQLSEFKKTLGQYDQSRVRFLVAQAVEDEVAQGAKLLEELYNTAKNDVRTPHDISCLKIGLKCGGSDGLSGITANPLLGRLSDYMASVGGTTVLTEVPEMFGAEQLLMSRAKDKQVFDKIVSLINDFKDYYTKNQQPIYENPSPGNKAGGITTLEDKSLGCTQKSGSSAVCDVIFDGQQLSAQGLNLLNGPGNDMVAVTNLALSGCHMVLFTTGRGTPFGGIVPTVKISTNSSLANRKSNWIDFDAGEIVTTSNFEQKLDELLHYVVDVANGKQTKNEMQNARDIALFKTGVTL